MTDDFEVAALPPTNYLELLDWRRRVSELFAELRRREPSGDTLAWFRAEKDALVGTHPQSPVRAAERARFRGLDYWPYDPAARVEARLTLDAAEAPDVPVSSADPIRLMRIGWLDFTYHEQPGRLAALWVVGYAGGLFVPFRDATGGSETYGAGRYALDTIKSADLGSDTASGTVTLDFNYAYHPSCAFDPRWACPLAPPENRLPFAVRAGERMMGGHWQP